MTEKGPYQLPADVAFTRVEVVMDHDIPCDNYEHWSYRVGHSLGVDYTVPTCRCGADRADHEESAL